MLTCKWEVEIWFGQLERALADLTSIVDSVYFVDRLGPSVATFSLLLVFTSQLRSTDSQQCQKLDLWFANSCGYDQTAKFTHESNFDHYAGVLNKTLGEMGNCSKYSDLMMCSLRLPRCKEDLYGPYLPCKSVCDEWAKGCRDQIAEKAYEWVLGYCRMLPQRDDPETAKGYLGRCFEPADFKRTPGMEIS